MVSCVFVPMSSHAQGRAIEFDIELPHLDWLSNETIPVDVRLKNAQFNTNYTLHWILSDVDDSVIESGSIVFKATGTVTSNTIELKHFYNSNHFYTFEADLHDASGALLAQADRSFTVFQNRLVAPIGNLVVFGDSLSDMGNAKDSILNVPDVPPYWQGRFSNGMVWVEYLSQAYGVTTTYGSGTSVGDNRAFGGAQTGPGFSYLLLPNVGSQISNYLANVQSSFAANDVVSLWAGGNDFLYGTANSDTIVTNMESHIRQLEAAGAKTFIIPNLPPLEKTPEILGRSQTQQQNIASEVASYNAKLASLVSSLKLELGITVYSVNAYSIFNDIIENKDALGLTNTQSSACSGNAGLLPLPICNSGDPVVANVDEYIFFDKAHPTRAMHQYIGRFAVESIGQADTDGDGIIDNNDVCDWTDDATTVNETGCSWAQRDDDADGVLNADDLCAGSEINSVVDEDGCADSQRDSDGDGKNDAIDPCRYSPNRIDYDQDGCSDSEDWDDDNDLVADFEDNCPKGIIGVHAYDLDEDGCSDLEDDDIDGDGLSNAEEDAIGADKRNPDTDGDGYKDGVDAFPIDSREWLDSDNDGCGDNTDEFPLNPLECIDTDEDGVGDNTDAFPADDSEWTDTDSDGVGDNSDDCLNEFGLSLFPLGCPDRDGDGIADTLDLFPNDPDEWSDEDGDGYGDNGDAFPLNSSEWVDSDNDSYGDNIDVFPLNSSEWFDSDEDGVGDNTDAFPLDGTEWLDSDGDGCGDNIDVWPMDAKECFDRDFDGVGDNQDAFPDSAYEWLDSDGDGLGDNADVFPFDKDAKYDSDGDGVPDATDLFPRNAGMDSFFDIGWRIWLFFTFIGTILFFIQRRNESNVNTKEWVQDTQIVPDEQHNHKPKEAPSSELFE